MNIKELVIDYIDTPIGKIPIVPHALNFDDRLGAWKVRWAIGRMSYTVEPGLYAVGNPDAGSPVLVSANYKLSFDSLRKELHDISAWILVLDTNGINVWCAAGKGTFGTGELINKIQETDLKKIVNHRQLIVPQLGAPGVAAHLIDFNIIISFPFSPFEKLEACIYLPRGDFRIVND
jgi:hypothetical protein